MENSNTDDSLKSRKAEMLAELGVNEEQMAQVKALLEANNYKVEDTWFFSVNPIYSNFNDQPKAYLSFSHELFYMTNSSSHWDFAATKEIQAQVNKCVELLEQIKAIAPTLVDPTFRDKRYEEKSRKAEAALKARVEAWNAKSQTEVLVETPGIVKIVLERGKVEYETVRKYGRHQFPANLILTTEKSEDKHFWPASYVSSNGHVQRKKFLRHYGDELGSAADLIVDSLPSLVKALEAAQRGN